MFVSLFKALCSPMFFFTKQLAFLVFSEFLPLLKAAGEKDVRQLAGCKPVLEGGPALQGGFVTQCHHHHQAVGHRPVFGVHLKFSVLLVALMLLQIGQSAPASPVTWQRNH